MKLKRLTVAHAVIAIAAAIVAACGSDQALLVSPHPGDAPPLGVVGNPSGAAVHPVSRQHPLPHEESWSFDVGPAGRTVHSPATGLTITVPPGAVSAPTHITVTAQRGATVAYRFEPHGLQFAQPLQLIQSLRGIRLGRASAGVPQLIGGYFATDTLAADAVTGNARVIEVLPVQIDVHAHDAILSVRHFSGYTVASAADDSVSIR